MRASEAIRDRRSIKRFTDRSITRDEIETLLAAATLAPNHRLTQPWRFYVLGPEARYAYGLALGERKALVFSLAGFTAQAVEWADRAGVACFEFAVDGSVEATSQAARALSR